jgi:hypothetical protein
VRNPPILISVIGFFGAIAGFAWLFFGARMLGFDWFGLFGDLPQYEHVGLWGWLAIAAGILWVAAAVGLWALQPWAWAFAMVVAGISLFEAALLMFQYFGTGVGFAAGLLPLVLILYLNSRDVKRAFGLMGADTPPSS